MDNIILLGINKKTGESLISWHGYTYYLSPPFDKACAKKINLDRTIDTKTKPNFKAWEMLQDHCVFEQIRGASEFIGGEVYKQRLKSAPLDGLTFNSIISDAKLQKQNKSHIYNIAKSLYLIELIDQQRADEVIKEANIASKGIIYDVRRTYPISYFYDELIECIENTELHIDNLERARNYLFLIRLTCDPSNKSTIAASNDAYAYISKNLRKIQAKQSSNDKKDWHSGKGQHTKKFIKGGYR